MDFPTKGIACDAGHSMKREVTEIRAVDLETGRELFRYEIGNQTVNIGEFLALIESIQIDINNYDGIVDIYSDSKTAIAWFNNRSTFSNKRNIDIIKGAVFLSAMQDVISNSVIVHKWETEMWGENPADLGNK